MASLDLRYCLPWTDPNERNGLSPEPKKKERRNKAQERGNRGELFYSRSLYFLEHSHQGTSKESRSKGSRLPIEFNDPSLRKVVRNKSSRESISYLREYVMVYEVTYIFYCWFVLRYFEFTHTNVIDIKARGISGSRNI